MGRYRPNLKSVSGNFHRSQTGRVVNKEIAVFQEASDEASVKAAITMGAKVLLFGYDDIAMLRNSSIQLVNELRQTIKETG